jgi:hypothetical protein
MRNTLHILLFVLLVFSDTFLFSQTGPAGVGSSANNVLWLKADEGTSSTTNSTAISFWNDQSGNGINVTQTVSAQQPSIVTNVMNGFPAVLFDNVSTANQNDKMSGADSPLLDNTNGYTFFTVTRPMNLDGNARVIVSKRTGVSIDQSFMLFYYTSNKLTIDVETTDDRFSSNTTYSNSVNYITSLTYNGAIATASLRCTLYNEETFDKNAVETSTLVPDNSSPLLIGTTDAGDPRPYGGYTSEIIIYREALVPAKRIIVNNYLSAKYNIPLSFNDKYFGDNFGNGDYDRDVSGIGQESTGGSTSFSASISGGLTISANSGLDNGDYLVAGHAVPTNTTITTDVGGMTGSSNARWLRTWYMDVTNILTDINANIEFDMSDGGMGAFTLGTVSNYVLLYRAGQSGNWTELSTASAITGDRIQFNSIALINDGYYTLGTRNYNNSPLPIELLYFKALPDQAKVNISWATASEKNTARFVIEKTQNGTSFEAVASVPAAGQSASTKLYSATDADPYAGISYYRLTELTTDGKANYFPLTVVSFYSAGDLIVFPNPSDNLITIRGPIPEGTIVQLSVKDLSGKVCYKKTILTSQNNVDIFIETKNILSSGTYLLSVSFADKTFERKIILK